eukprot:140399-Prymnesium_polylepis.1
MAQDLDISDSDELVAVEHHPTCPALHPPLGDKELALVAELHQEEHLVDGPPNARSVVNSQKRSVFVKSEKSGSEATMSEVPGSRCKRYMGKMDPLSGTMDSFPRGEAVQSQGGGGYYTA